jgi:hypothetical protein
MKVFEAVRTSATCSTCAEHQQCALGHAASWLCCCAECVHAQTVQVPLGPNYKFPDMFERYTGQHWSPEQALHTAHEVVAAVRPGQVGGDVHMCACKRLQALAAHSKVPGYQL